MRPSPIEAARLRHRLADVALRTGIEPWRNTGSVMVRCPFRVHGHFDRSPSLRLHLDDDIFHCFGCGATGDVVEWVCQTERVDWRGAIQILDAGHSLTNSWAHYAAFEDRAHVHSGMRATRPHVAAPDRLHHGEAPDLTRTTPERVFGALEAAWTYHTQAHLHDRGVAYLASRCIDVGILEAHTARHEVGHTPPKPDGLVCALRTRGFTDDELVDSALAYRRTSDGFVGDFYRRRVLVPIRDGDNRICGFIGRNVGDPRWPKYKNPPLTHSYDKSVNLYQPLPAPTDRAGRVVVVEGTLDAMAIAVAAIESGRTSEFCPVTQSGRELSHCQIKRVVAMHRNSVVLAFDADTAGRDSTIRVGREAVAAGHKVIAALLPEGQDPASWLAARGPDGLEVFASGLRQIRVPGASRAGHAGALRRVATGMSPFRAPPYARSPDSDIAPVIS